MPAWESENDEPSDDFMSDDLMSDDFMEGMFLALGRLECRDLGKKRASNSAFSV